MGFSAALLAGGRSRRMGRDKAFMEFGEPPRPLWERQLALLVESGAQQVMISHNAQQAFEPPEGVDLVGDDELEAGPLGGLVSCLRRLEDRASAVAGSGSPVCDKGFFAYLDRARAWCCPSRPNGGSI